MENIYQGSTYEKFNKFIFVENDTCEGQLNIVVFESQIQQGHLLLVMKLVPRPQSFHIMQIIVYTNKTYMVNRYIHNNQYYLIMAKLLEWGPTFPSIAFTYYFLIPTSIQNPEYLLITEFPPPNIQDLFTLVCAYGA